MELENIFKALDDVERRKILMFLKEKDLTAGEIVSKFNLSNSTISYHLSILKKSKMIQETKYKNFIIYRINQEIVKGTVNWLLELT